MSGPESAGWVEAQLDAVFARYEPEAVSRTMPALLLLLGRDFGIDDLTPKLQDAVVEVLVAIGLTEHSSKSEIESKTRAFLEANPPDERLIADVGDVLSLHYAALDGRATNDFKKLVDDKTERSAPRVGEPAPPNTQSGESIKRQGLGKIRS